MPRRLLPILTGLLLILAIAPAMVAPRASGRGVGEAAPDLVLFDARLAAWQGAELTASAEAAQVTFERGDGHATGRDVHVRLPGRGEGARDLEVWAAQVDGVLTAERRDATASGGLRLEDSAGTKARTEAASYDGATGEARGVRPVWVTSPDYGLAADSFRLSVPERRYRFEGAVETYFGAESGGVR